MSDEEKEAIEYWKTHMGILHWNTQLASEHYMKILLNLIEEQQKEIEELRNEVMEKEMIIYGMKEDRRIAVEEIQEQYYVSKDKIKARIEPVLKQLERKMKEEYNHYGNSREYQDIADAYNFLQSLLEKE